MDTRCVSERASGSARENFLLAFGVFAEAGSAEQKPPSRAHSLRFSLVPPSVSLKTAGQNTHSERPKVHFQMKRRSPTHRESDPGPTARNLKRNYALETPDYCVSRHTLPLCMGYVVWTSDRMTPKLRASIWEELVIGSRDAPICSGERTFSGGMHLVY
jgi:hypothetical protein